MMKMFAWRSLYRDPVASWSVFVVAVVTVGVVVPAFCGEMPDSVPGYCSGYYQAEAQSDSTYVMVIYGDTRMASSSFPLPTGTIVFCTNSRTGEVAEGIVGAVQSGYYEAVFFSTESYVAAVGDTIVITVEDADFDPPNGLYELSADDLLLGSARIDVVPDSISSAPFPGAAGVFPHCYPNPFNPCVTVAFHVSTDQHVEVAVYDLSGKKVAELASQRFEAGDCSVTWRGCGLYGEDAPTGVYLVQIRSVSGIATTKVSLVR